MNRNLGDIFVNSAIVCVVAGAVVFFATRPSGDASRQLSDTMSRPPVADGEVEAKRWSYDRDIDSMTGGQVTHACLTSRDQVRQVWPYENTTADLCIRNAPRSGLEIDVSLSAHGQLICDFDNCVIRARFDDLPFETFRMSHAADGSTETAFITPAKHFLARLKSARRTRIELTIYKAGTQTIAFESAGLIWPRPRMIMHPPN